ncbi:MAG: sulfatase [Planctomycetaceae bacterium]|nr:sulfatase [Planctomycetaceae bacterium]
MHDQHPPLPGETRRSLLGRGARGLGGMALASLLNPRAFPPQAAAAESDQWTGVVRPLNFVPRAKRVIHLYQAGGPSHLETFDFKPELVKFDGKPMPDSLTKGQPIAQLQGKELRVMGAQHPFGKYGESGQEICSIFPHLGSVADEIAIVRSMFTKAINHDPAHSFMNAGTSINGAPSAGSWWLYGLGAETDELPGFVVLSSVGKFGQAQPIAARQWSAGFLPSRFQGVEFRSEGDPVLYVGNPAGVTRERQRRIVGAVNKLNELRDDVVDNPEIATRITQYEMAFKMQASVPGLIDISGESQETLDLYGTKGADGSFAANCLLARRLAERGVRFIQLYHRAWDHHGGIQKNMSGTAAEVDRATAALIMDLKRRGMLDETLILFGGEFGRTPMAQGSGRDHHIKGFSMMLCGGGIKGGVTYGATDDFGYNAVEDRVSVHDLHATMYHLFGIDFKRFTIRFQGLDFGLTGVEEPRVLREILA